MKPTLSLRTFVLDCICFLYILLFIYAATNKILDFENFQVQLAQSPLLSAFTGPVSYAVPIIEIVLALGLSVRNFRLVSLYSSFALMAMFTAYILIILHFSPFVPCSCGGILEKLGWTEHLVFNIGFVLLGLAGILIAETATGRPLKTVVAYAGGSFACSCALIGVLFVLSEDMMRHRNNFTRRFYGIPAELVQDHPLASKSYIAGVGPGKVYICDNRDPLKVFEYDTYLKNVRKRTITTNEPNRAFRSLRVVVKPPYFYLYDGLEAFAFSGTVGDWKAKIWIDQLAYFNSFVAIDSSRAGIRAIRADNHESILGVMRRSHSQPISFNKHLLDKQIDGFFDTDGKLLYNAKHQKLIYVYFYRNEYLLTDLSLSEKIVAKTIDTTSRANIKVAYVKRLQGSKIASPMRTVNKFAATYGDFLYIHSNLIGQFEEKEMWKQASVIDVYRITDRSYLFSFYLYDKHHHKISDFVVGDGKIYTIAGLTLSVYDFDATPYEKKT